jgi:hypothetical protein
MAEALQARLDGLGPETAALVGRMDALGGELESLLGRLGEHDAEAARVAGRLSAFDGEFARLDARLGELDAVPATNLPMEEVDRLAKAVDTLNAEAGRVSERLSGFDREFARIDGRLVALTTQLDDVARHEGSILSRRVDDLARQTAGTETSGLYLPPGATSAARGEPLTIFVSSYGRTATYWLAQVLGAHPDVIASHGPTTPPIVEFADETPVETDLFVWDNMDAFFALTLEQAIADMRKLGKAKFYVKVHSYSAYNLYNRILTERYAKPLGIANVLRHPVTRAESFARRWRANAKTNPKMKKFMVDWWKGSPDAPGLIRALGKAKGVDLARTDDMFFAAACLWLRQDREDLTVPVLHVPSERLVEDIDYFAWFARQITGGRLALTRDYLDRVQKTGPKNASGDAARGALETWEGWAPWQRTAFRHAAELYGLKSLYGRLPYDLGFVG